MGYRLDDQGTGVQFLVDVGDISPFIASRLTLGLTKPPIQWVPGAKSPEVK
jgi:hypothetical protein